MSREWNDTRAYNVYIAYSAKTAYIVYKAYNAYIAYIAYNAYVTYNSSLVNNGLFWKIPNVEVEGGIVDELQNLQSLLTRNYVTERKQYADALKSITSELCETRRKVNLNNLR